MFSSADYLLSKRSVDDRALNRSVLDVVKARWPGSPDAQVLELGGGPGTMLERLSEWGVLRPCHYTTVDLDGSCLDVAARKAQALPVAVDFKAVTAELDGWLQTNNETFDVIIANAVLDLLDLEVSLPRILDALAPGGTFWFSINFDGETIFMPELEGDHAVLDAYHGSMGHQRRQGAPIGDAWTGRRLFTHLHQCRATILEAGSSDWVVFARCQADGTMAYPAHEQDFLQFIMQTIDAELREVPALQGVIAPWLAERYAQIERQELVFVAHQLDFVGTR